MQKRVSCPNCNEEFDAKIYPSINVTTDPQLREPAFDDRLFKTRCPSCGQEFLLNYPILYNNMKKRFMIYMIPGLDRFSLIDEGLEEKYSTVGNVRKRLAPTYNRLKEKVFIFESGLDDMPVEITKLYVSELVAKKYNLQKVEDGYLSMYNRETNSLGFTFLIGEEQKPYVQSARLEIYGKAVSMVSEVAQQERQMRGFINIDREWAENVIFRYKRFLKQKKKT
jgi:hypothetical protein